MKQILYLLKKDYIRFWTDRPAVALTFILPAVLIIIFGNIFSGGGSRGKIDVIFVKNSQAPVAELIESKLDSVSSLRMIKTYRNEETETTEAITETQAIESVKKGEVSAAIVLPEDCFTDTSSSVKIKLYYDPKNEIETSLVQGEIQRAIMTQIPKIIPALLKRKAEVALGKEKGNGFNSRMAEIISEYWGVPKDSVLNSIDINNIAAFESNDSGTELFTSVVNIEQTQLVGKEIENPGIARTSGGWAMMFLLFTIVGAASSLFEEKQEGVLKRLLCMPVKRSHILWSKYIYSISLGVVQLLVLFFVSWLLFDLDIFSNFWNLLIMIVASAMAAVSFGMLITSFATSMNQANGIATLIILIMSALGGAWFPIFLLPDWMQTISKATIVYWSVEGFLNVLWRQTPFAGIAINVLILVTISFVVNFYSVVRIRNGKIFN